MKYIIIIGVIVLIGLSAFFLFKGNSSVNDQSTDVATNLNPTTTEQTIETKTEPITNSNDKKMTKETRGATLNTSMGNIKIEFFSEQSPKTVANFAKLAKSGFYDKIKFHRVIKGFMIQAGDPLTKDESKVSLWGTGGPGYKFDDEIDAKSDLYTKIGYKKGIVAMANSGPNTNGSQFFIMHEDNSLPPAYTIFGHVVAGLDVVEKIGLVKTGVNDRPVTAVVINSVSIE